jgi:AraC-like DNA-binding protein
MTHVFEPKLPFWKTVVFVDWNGVLSRDPFWVSILARDRHPARSRLLKEATRLFRDGELIDRWMRGEITSREIVDGMDFGTEDRYGRRYFERQLFKDCARMEVNRGLLALLAEISDRAFIVVATDNMDCFYEQLLLLRSKRRNARGDGESTTLARVARHFDDVLCSSALRALKSERPAEFFGRWLNFHQLTFARALLLDDNNTNCDAFRKMGGVALRVNEVDFANGFTDVSRAVVDWLDCTVPAEYDAGASDGDTFPYSQRRQLRLPF